MLISVTIHLPIQKRSNGLINNKIFLWHTYTTIFYSSLADHHVEGQKSRYVSNKLVESPFLDVRYSSSRRSLTNSWAQ